MNIQTPIPAQPMSPAQEAAYQKWATSSPRPPAAPKLSLFTPTSVDTGWGWNRWIGVHYNGLPVGVLLVVVLLILTRL